MLHKNQVNSKRNKNHKVNMPVIKPGKITQEVKDIAKECVFRSETFRGNKRYAVTHPDHKRGPDYVLGYVRKVGSKWIFIRGGAKSATVKSRTFATQQLISAL